MIGRSIGSAAQLLAKKLTGKLTQVEIRNLLLGFAKRVYLAGFNAGYNHSRWQNVTIHKTENLCPACKAMSDEVTGLATGPRRES